MKAGARLSALPSMVAVVAVVTISVPRRACGGNARVCPCTGAKVAVCAIAGTAAALRHRAKAVAAARVVRRRRVVWGVVVGQRCMVYIQGLETAFYKAWRCRSPLLGLGVVWVQQAAWWV